MARETRIGLVVGMGFIICFAVILSHRGQPPAGSGPQSFDVTGAGREIQPLVNTQLAEQRARRLGHGRETDSQTRTPADRESQARPVAMDRPEGRSVAPTEDFVLPRRDPITTSAGADARATASSASRPDRFTARGEPMDIGTPHSDTPAVIDAPPVSVTMTQASRERMAEPDNSQPLVLRMPPRLDSESLPLDQPTEAVANMPVALSDTGSESARMSSTLRESSAQYSAPRDEPAPMIEAAFSSARVDVESSPGETYTVQPGDTLSRIAQVRYGTCAPSVLEAIYEANRGAMKSPDHIVVGKTIVLPLLDSQQEDAPPAPADTPKPAPAPLTPTKTVKPAYAYVYEVQPGDSLSRIASRHYGSAAPHILDAICEANVDVIASRDRVVVGHKIKLPEIDGAGRSHTHDAAPVEDNARALVAVDMPEQKPATEQAEDQSADEGMGWRWYQLQKGDVYSRVAAQHLGSSKRWKELAEINKDIFPDPARIRHGVLIRVPIEHGGNVTSEDYGQRG